MGITIFTWEAHFSAPTMKGCPLALGGWPTVLDFVHTHPLPGRYTFSEQDVISENRKRASFKKSTKQPGRLRPLRAERVVSWRPAR